MFGGGTGNPAFNNSAYTPAQSWAGAGAVAAPQDPNAMTLQGTINKSGLLIAITAVTAIFGWNFAFDGTEPTGMLMPMLFGGLIGGAVLSLIGIFAPKTTPVVAPLYAFAEGAFVAGISGMYAARFAQNGDDGGLVLNTGLIFNAALLTFGIFGGLLAAYSLKLIRPNKLFYNITIVGTMGVCFYAVIALVMSFLGMGGLASVYDPSNGGLIAIGFSALVVALASANLVIDFDQVNIGVQNRAPKYMEWFSGMAMLISLVWLYISILRLLSQLASRD